MFDKFSNCKNRTNIEEYRLYLFNTDSSLESSLDDIILECTKNSNSGYVKVSKKELDCELLKSYFD